MSVGFAGLAFEMRPTATPATADEIGTPVKQRFQDTSSKLEADVEN